MKENSALKKRVGIWIRVSTEDQAQGDSPEHHEQRAREYAKFNDWTVAEVYDLAGVSGKTVMENAEAKRMIADVKRGHITGLIFSKLARLARNTKELLEFADFFRLHNADMVSLQEKIDTSSPAGRLFYTMIAAMAQWEREETVDRVKASIAVRAKNGSPIEASYSKQKRPAKKPVHIFSGVLHCGCGQRMYVPSNSPKYICRGCRNKITIADLDGIFCEEIKGYSLSPDAIANYLKSSNETANGKERLIPVQREELQPVQKEMQRTFDLYQQEKLDADGFSKFYTPLEERRKQLETEIPRLEAEVDLLKVSNLSAEEIASQASNLYDHWQTMQPAEKREIIEIITDKIIIGKDEITINLCYAPSCKDMANRWRKGSFLRPYCHLLIKTIRHDSPLFNNQQAHLCKLLLEKRLAASLTQKEFAKMFGVSVRTLKNWEHSRNKPAKSLWPQIHQFLGGA
jgi:DNA invertase Pin-like site-specific DNA recombinase/DNA-binding XRE family transcriptional regulator